MDSLAAPGQARPYNLCLLADDLTVPDAYQVVDLARGLDKARFHVVVATLTSGQPLESDLYSEPGVRLLSVDAAGRWDIRAASRLAGHLRTGETDILHTFGGRAARVGGMAGGRARAAIHIATDHLPSPRGLLTRFLDKHLTRTADVHVATNAAKLADLTTCGTRANDVRLIYPGISALRVSCTPGERRAARAALNVRADEPVVGTMLHAPNAVEQYLVGASIVARHVPSTRFVIVGEDPRSDELNARIAELGLTRRAVFTGELRQPGPFIGAMDVFVDMYEGPSDASAFTLQAMALARPVVVPDTAGNHDLFASGEAGLFIPAGDPMAMATAVLRILTSPPLSGGLSTRGREIFERRFTQATMVGAYERLYCELWERNLVGPRGAEELWLEAR